MHRSSQQIR